MYNETLEYLRAKTDDELIAMANEITKDTLEVDSPLRVACEDLFKKFDFMLVLQILSVTAIVLGERLTKTNLDAESLRSDINYIIDNSKNTNKSF